MVRICQITQRTSSVCLTRLWPALSITCRGTHTVSSHQKITPKCAETVKRHIKTWASCTVKCRNWTGLRTRLNLRRTCASMWRMQWTLLGSFGVEPSTVRSPAATRCPWLLCLCSFSSCLSSSTSVASFTQSKRNANSFYPNVSSRAPVLPTFKKMPPEACKTGTRPHVVPVSVRPQHSREEDEPRSDKLHSHEMLGLQTYNLFWIRVLKFPFPEHPFFFFEDFCIFSFQT